MTPLIWFMLVVVFLFLSLQISGRMVDPVRLWSEPDYCFFARWLVVFVVMVLLSIAAVWHISGPDSLIVEPGEVLSESVDETTELESVTFESDGKGSSSGTYTVVDAAGRQSSYSTSYDGFELVPTVDEPQRIEKATVVERSVLGGECTKQITRLYVNQPTAQEG